jgi:putative hydrolase of the HAD superfamily
VLSEFFDTSVTEQDYAKLAKVWLVTYLPDQQMIGLALRLKQHYRIGVLSNSDPLHAVQFRQEDWFKGFDAVVLSNELGIIKPDPRIYQQAASLLGVSPSECLFIDDMEIYCKGAEQAGMQSIRFGSYAQLLSELRKRDIVGI